MADLNSSTVGNCPQCFDDTNNSGQFVNQEIPQDPNQATMQSQMIASTVCCSKKNCDQVKLELMPEQFFRFEPVQTTAFSVNCPDGSDVSSSPSSKEKKKEAGETEVPAAPEPLMPFCPCTMNGGQLVTYCCMRPDCEESTKIPGVPQRKANRRKF